MLPDVSITSSTSLKTSGAVPHAPLQETDCTAPVEPLLMPTTPAKPYWVVVELTITTVLHVSLVWTGSHDDERVGPAPLKSLGTGAWASENDGSQSPGMSRLMNGAPLPSMPIRQRNWTVYEDLAMPG